MSNYAWRALHGSSIEFHWNFVRSVAMSRHRSKNNYENCWRWKRTFEGKRERKHPRGKRFHYIRWEEHYCHLHQWAPNDNSSPFSVKFNSSVTAFSFFLSFFLDDVSIQQSGSRKRFIRPRAKNTFFIRNKESTDKVADQVWMESLQKLNSSVNFMLGY